MEEFLQEAMESLNALRQVATQLGLRYVDLGTKFVGGGFAIAWSDANYTVVSVMGGGNERQVIFTAGILRDVTQDRLAVLNACNRQTQNNSAYPTFLHDAEAGWDVLTQMTIPIPILLQSPDYFSLCVEAPATVSTGIREEMAAAGIGGRPYYWNDEDIDRLFTRSML